MRAVVAELAPARASKERHKRSKRIRRSKRRS
jgi:hypothetical protein